MDIFWVDENSSLGHSKLSLVWAFVRPDRDQRCHDGGLPGASCESDSYHPNSSAPNLHCNTCNYIPIKFIPKNNLSSTIGATTIAVTNQ